MALRFGNVDASPDDAVTTWPYEALVTAIERARQRAEDDEQAEVAARVRVAIARSGCTAAQFARLVGTSPSRMSTYAGGKVVPSAAMLVRIERAGSISDSQPLSASPTSRSASPGAGS